MKNLKNKIEAMYIDWTNNFLTIPKFADHYQIDEIRAERIIDIGRLINHKR